METNALQIYEVKVSWDVNASIQETLIKQWKMHNQYFQIWLNTKDWQQSKIYEESMKFELQW